MLETMTNFSLAIMDTILGWSLYLPRFAVLLILAFGTALILTVIRKFTTNQDRLGRAKADKKRLKALLRQAKKAGDREAVKRFRTTIGEIGMLNMKSELLPLLASLVPVALLAIWAFARIGYLPPRADAPVAVQAHFSTSEIGNLVHMVPQKGLRADNWIQRIGPDKDKEGNVVNGVATWQLACTEGGGSFVLPIRYKGQTYGKELVVDGHKYADPVRLYDDDAVRSAALVMTEYRPLGIVPPIDDIPVWGLGRVPLGLPAWLVCYLIIVIPLSFILKPVLRIY